VRRRTAKRPVVSKRTQLEDKLDDLVSLLRTQQTVVPHDPTTEQQIITPSSLDYSPQHAFSETSFDERLTDEELAHCRQLHLSYFPFLNLPSSLTGEQLLDEKPLLSMALKTICTKAYTKQDELSRKLRGTIAQQLMVDGEKSLDLLVSLLTCMAWYYILSRSQYLTKTFRSIYFTPGKKFLVMFSSLARSLASDLRLDRTSHPTWCPSTVPFAEDGIAHSNECKRALLACYALTAM
jgi:hypothetical protein